MSQDEKRFTKGQAAAERNERLEQALRENLKKRKRQARARKGKDGDGETEPKPDEA